MVMKYSNEATQPAESWSESTPMINSDRAVDAASDVLCRPKLTNCFKKVMPSPPAYSGYTMSALAACILRRVPEKSVLPRGEYSSPTIWPFPLATADLTAANEPCGHA